MGLRINTNVASLSALRSLKQVDRSQQRTMERLSTGLRINKAADDPSGLVISEQLRAQIGSLRQALRNTENATNLVGTAEAALSEVSELLISIRASAVFALNEGGASNDQIRAEQDSVDAAIVAIDRIASSTRFGRRNLLDGSAGIMVAAKNASLAAVNVRSMDFDGLESRTVNVTVTTIGRQASANTGVAGNATMVSAAGDASIRITGFLGAAMVTLGASANGSDLRDAINLVSTDTGIYASSDAAGAGGDILIKSIGFGEDEFITIEQIAGSGVLAAGAIMTRTEGVDTVATIGGLNVTGTGNHLNLQSSMLSVSVDIAASATGAELGAAPPTMTFRVLKSGLNFQLGTEARTSDSYRLGINSVDTATLGTYSATVANGSGTTASAGGPLNSLISGGKNDLLNNPSRAISIIDSAIDEINSTRSGLGSLQANMLESAQDTLGIALESVIKSESMIRDLDFAQETAEFTKNQILFQATTAVLASANLQQQTVLTLLQ